MVQRGDTHWFANQWVPQQQINNINCEEKIQIKQKWKQNSNLKKKYDN